MRRISRPAGLTAALVMLWVAQAARAAEPLPALTIDLAQTSVSGLSSGAYMAGQFHVAFSGTLVGAGIVAGGLYRCAEGQLRLALNRCMQTSQGKLDPAALLAQARSLATAGTIDPVENLADDRIYVFTGTADRTVLPRVGAHVPKFYELAGVPATNIRHDATLNAGHAFITESGPVPCAQTREPFVNDCDIDQAGIILEHIYGPLQPPAAEVHAPFEFSQDAYLGSAESNGMAATGWVYVPASCVPGTICRGISPSTAASRRSSGSATPTRRARASTAGPRATISSCSIRRLTRRRGTRTPAGTGGAIPTSIMRRSSGYEPVIHHETT